MWKLSPRQYDVLRYLLYFIALASIAFGFREALVNSGDFQWSPSKLIWSGRNPYQAYLDGDRVAIILEQAPNYGNFLYAVLFPFAMLQWEQAKPLWAVTNVLLLAFSAYQGCQLLSTRSQRVWWLTALALACIGHAVKLVIGNGQHTLLCLAAMLMILRHIDRPWVSGLGLAILMGKYSFGVFLVPVLLLQQRFKPVFVAAGLSLCSLLLFSFLTATPPWLLLIQPLIVASRDVPISTFDLMSMWRLTLQHHEFPPSLGGALIAAVNLAYLGLVWRFRDAIAARQACFAAALGGGVLMSLGSVFHLGYDLAAMLFWVLAMLLNQPAIVDRLFKQTLIGIFVLYWSVPRLARFFHENPFSDARIVGLLALGLVVLAFGGLIRACRQDQSPLT
jgi:hypothetical protein